MAEALAHVCELGFVNWGWGLGRCWECGDALVPNEVAGICPPCRWVWPTLPDHEASHILARERAGCEVFGVGFRLRNGTHDVLHRVKYGGFPREGYALGQWMAQGWRAPPPGSVLVPVPLHWRRRWRRGFNPPEAVAEGLATGWGRELRPDLLRRVRHRASLTASTRAARLDALTDMYVAGPKNRRNVASGPPGDSAGCEVVLVDDVLTTGATFRVCRSVLEAAGHRVIGGVWLAMA